MAEVKKENKAWKITSVILNCIFYIFIALLLIFSISSLTKKGELGIPSLFGKGYLAVKSESMTGHQKDSFTVKDLIFVDVINDKNRDKKTANLEIGDIVTFEFYSQDVEEYILNTHRIVDISVKDGKTFYVTQGDFYFEDQSKKYEKNPNLEDKDPYYDRYYETITAKDIKGIYTGKLTGFGSFIKFLQTSTGFLVCIVIPTALFFVFEAIMLVMNFTKIKSHKKELATAEAHEQEMASMKAELEAEKEKMRQEILAEMQAKEKLEEKQEETKEE